MAKNYQQLWKDVASASDEGKAVRTLVKIVLDKEGRVFILGLERNYAELCMEILDRGIAEHELMSTERNAFFIVLRKLAAIHGRLPEFMMITDEIKVSDEILPSGGYADVRIGTYKGHLIAAKTMRISKQDDLLKIRKQFCKQVVLWNTLSHPNILKLIGVWGDMNKGEFITVSEWMAHGNIMEYIRKNHVNRLELLHGAAQGLKYLHRANLVHGDVKGANILMSNDEPPRACLADFGFMTMVLDPGQPMSCRAQLGSDTVMFMSPELLVPSKFGPTESTLTPEADIYAFGLVIHQVLTGKLPFPRLGMTETVFNALEGVHPTKPENASAIGFSDSLWSFVQHCWDREMELRPKVAEVVSQLESAATDWNGVMPPCAQVESVVSAPSDPMEDSMAHGGIFGRPSQGLLESDTPPTSPESFSDSVSRPDTLADMDNQSSPHRDSINLQGNEGQLEDLENTTETENEALRSPLKPVPPLPQPPTNCFSRQGIVSEILDLTDQVASTALYGLIGVGKSFVALSVLHHNRTKAIFGRNRHFLHCGNLTDSLGGFLERLSDATGLSQTTDIGQLRSHLESSSPRLLILDGVDAILDPPAPEAKEISAIIEELGSNQHVCLVTTSRIYPDIHGFHRVEVPMLSEDGAREAFYNLCNLGRSPAVDDLIAELDFHPFSIDLLARSVREKDWDATMLLQAWKDEQTSGLGTNYRQNLKETLELSLRSPTIKNLGTSAQDTLNAMAAFPPGIEEGRLGRNFPYITGIEVAVEVLCRFSLIYRQDGFVKMLSPFRSYFLDSMVVPAQYEEVIRWGPDCSPAKAWLPIYTAGPPQQQPSRTTELATSLLNVKWGRKLRPKRREHCNLLLFEDFIDRFKDLRTFLCLGGESVDLDDVQAAVPVNPRSVHPVQQGSSAAVEAYNVE